MTAPVGVIDTCKTQTENLRQINETIRMQLNVARDDAASKLTGWERGKYRAQRSSVDRQIWDESVDECTRYAALIYELDLAISK